jgi:hypothetical protein
MTRFDPNHPHRPRGYLGSAVEAYRAQGDEAPWLLAWRGGEVMINPETGRYMYDSEVRAEADSRGRGGRRH